MRILHCIPNMFSGGAQQQLSYLVAEQRRSGLDVHVFYLYPGPKLRLFEGTGAVLHRLMARGNYDPRLFPGVRGLVRRLTPDILQTWLLQMDVLGGLVCRRDRWPWILAERASEAYWTGTGGPKVWLRARLGRRADATASNSRAGDAYWATRASPSALRRVIPNSIPMNQILDAPARADVRCGLAPGQKVVLYAGRLSPEKNLEALIPALGELARRLPMTAFLCGDGTHEAQARALVDALGPGCDVRIVGYAEDVWSRMKAADVFVSVSHSEGHPNTVLEAAACGSPLVLSDIPSHRDMFTNSEAVFVDRRSPVAIADALEKVLRNPVEAKGRAEAARAAVAPLSVEAMARSYDELYREVLERRKKAAR